MVPRKEGSRQPTHVDKQVPQPERSLLPIFMPDTIRALALGVVHSFIHNCILSTYILPGIGYKVINDIVLPSTSFSLVGVGVQGFPRRCKYSLSFVLTEYSQILYLQMCLLTNIWKPEIHTCSASVVICRYTHAPHHRNWELPSHAFPAQGEQGYTRPSGSSAHTRNDRPLHGLFGATWSHLCTFCY